MKAIYYVIPCIAVLAACASEPDAIAPIAVAGDPYSGYGCTNLAQERLKITQELEIASAQQKKAAEGDALGVFLLGLPISSMSGADKEATIAVAKGRIQEIDRQRQAKRCK